MVIKKNVLEDTSVRSEDVPPALPPKIGTPTRPCPPPPGMRVGIYPKSTEMLFLFLKNTGVSLTDLNKGLLTKQAKKHGRSLLWSSVLTVQNNRHESKRPACVT